MKRPELNPGSAFIAGASSSRKPRRPSSRSSPRLSTSITAAYGMLIPLRSSHSRAVSAPIRSAHRRAGLSEGPSAAFEIFCDVGLEPVVFDRLDDGRTGCARLGKVRLDVIDVNERLVRYSRGVANGRVQHDGAVADTDLDPVECPRVLVGQRCRRLEPERIAQPVCGGDW